MRVPRLRPLPNLNRVVSPCDLPQPSASRNEARKRALRIPLLFTSQRYHGIEFGRSVWPRPLGTTRFVESFLYGTKANDPWTLSLAAGILALLAALAGFLPARKVSRLEPMNALREE